MKLLTTMFALLGLTVFLAGCTKPTDAPAPKAAEAPEATDGDTAMPEGDTVAPEGDVAKPEGDKVAPEATKKDEAKPEAKKEEAKPATPKKTE